MGKKRGYSDKLVRKKLLKFINIRERTFLTIWKIKEIIIS